MLRLSGRGTGHLYRPQYRGADGQVRRSGIWWFKVGRHRCSTGCRERKAAEAWRIERLAEMGRGNLVGLRAAVLRYEDCERMLCDAHKLEQRKSPLSCQLKHLRAYFAGWRAAEITSAAARAYATKRRGEGAAVGTCNVELSRLRRMLRLAWQAGKLQAQPFVPLLPGARVRRGFLELGDVQAVIAALPVRYRPVVTFLALTGWRLSEATGLTWDRVDLAAQEIRLDTSKSGAPRCIPYRTYPPLRELVDAQLASRLAFARFVFPGRAGRRVNRRTVERAWKAATVTTGHAGSLLHDLRRSFVRRCELAGIPRQVAMSITGHASEQVYLRYAITDRSAQEDGLARLAEQQAIQKVQQIRA